MGSLKSLKLKGLKICVVAIAIVLMLTASTLPVYAVQEKASETRHGEGQDSLGSKVEYREEKIEEIPYKKLYMYSEDIPRGTTEVKVKGETGTKKVIGKVTTMDGAIVAREEISTSVIKDAVDEIVLIGGLQYLPETNFDFEDEIPSIETVYEPTVYVSLPDDEKGTKDGRAIVDYALKFLGSPYAWGGTSLKYGCDCSGFVYSVFSDLGYDVPRNGFEYEYPVSVDEMLPGDVISYPDHYAIYIGGGMEVSALNYYKGVCITPVGYVGGWYFAVRIADN